MSYLLFVDESGHDHKVAPYEVTGGIALHSSKVWSFVQQVQRLELETFGAPLSQYRSEIKGSKLLGATRFKWAAQAPRLADDARRRLCRSFLTKGLEKKPPSRDEFTAYGQASLEMARGMFELLRQHDARLFASAIPASATKPPTFQTEDYLRKDHVFPLERFFYFLEAQKQHGLLVLDAVDRGADQRFVRRLQRYFTRTLTGRYRAAWIVPVPMFVSSDMTYPVQAADMVIYCINWGFRKAAIGMTAPEREEIARDFGPWLHQLQLWVRGIAIGKSSIRSGSALCRNLIADPKKGDKAYRATQRTSRPATESPMSICHGSGRLGK